MRDRLDPQRCQRAIFCHGNLDVVHIRFVPGCSNKDGAVVANLGSLPRPRLDVRRVGSGPGRHLPFPFRLGGEQFRRPGIQLLFQVSN